MDISKYTLRLYDVIRDYASFATIDIFWEYIQYTRHLNQRHIKIGKIIWCVAENHKKDKQQKLSKSVIHFTTYSQNFECQDGLWKDS